MIKARDDNDLYLLASPLEIAQVAEKEEILDALQKLHHATLTENDRKIRRARYESRRILMKHRPSLFM